MRTYSVYIMASRSRVLYTGVTADLLRRVAEHRSGQGDGFTARYGVSRLVYFETTENVRSAIAREKEIKRWSRAKKVKLIRSTNPRWWDLSEEWFR